MATLTIRLSDEKHERLRQLAERRKISMNKLLDELSTIALAELDAETRFRARAGPDLCRKAQIDEPDLASLRSPQSAPSRRSSSRKT